MLDSQNSPQASIKNSPMTSIYNSIAKSVQNSPKMSLQNTPLISVFNTPQFSLQNTPITSLQISPLVSAQITLEVINLDDQESYDQNSITVKDKKNPAFIDQSMVQTSSFATTNKQKANEKLKSVAASANKKRFTLMEEVKKQLGKDIQRRQSEEEIGQDFQEEFSPQKEIELEDIKNKQVTQNGDKEQDQEKERKLKKNNKNIKQKTRSKNLDGRNNKSKRKVVDTQLKNSKILNNSKRDQDQSQQKQTISNNYLQPRKVQFDEKKIYNLESLTFEQKELLQAQTQFSKRSSKNSEIQTSVCNIRSKSTDFDGLDITNLEEKKRNFRPRSAKVNSNKIDQDQSLKKRKSIIIRPPSTMDYSIVTTSSKNSEVHIDNPSKQKVQNNQKYRIILPEQSSQDIQKQNIDSLVNSPKQCSSSHHILDIQKEKDKIEQKINEVHQDVYATREIRSPQLRIQKAAISMEPHKPIFIDHQADNISELIQKRKLQPYRWSIDDNYKNKLKFRVGQHLKPLLLS